MPDKQPVASDQPPSLPMQAHHRRTIWALPSLILSRSPVILAATAPLFFFLQYRDELQPPPAPSTINTNPERESASATKSSVS